MGHLKLRCLDVPPYCLMSTGQGPLDWSLYPPWFPVSSFGLFRPLLVWMACFSQSLIVFLMKFMSAIVISGYPSIIGVLIENNSHLRYLDSCYRWIFYKPSWTIFQFPVWINGFGWCSFAHECLWDSLGKTITDPYRRCSLALLEPYLHVCMHQFVHELE